MHVQRTQPIDHACLKVRRSLAGLGLFATCTIKSGQYLEYVGKIITNEKANSMKGARYLFEINSKWTINGASRENLARYVNHSCKPNCESTQVGKHVFIKAIKTIQVGEELCYDYGKEYFDEFIKPIGCKCKKCKPLS
jgi:SET domain-containing protein